MAGAEKTRPIAFDDSSKDFLDTQDLRWALSDAMAVTGRRIDLIGMDACLMAMIEGARELAPFTDYFVASQEVEPMEGWPYAAILRAINAHPEIDGAALAGLIVDEYARSYGGKTRSSETVTQSATVTSRTGLTEALAKELVDALLADPAPLLRSMAQRAADQALVFQDRNYRDLGSFAAALATEATWNIHRNARRVKAAAEALRDHLGSSGPEGPILRLGYLAPYRARNRPVGLPSSSTISDATRRGDEGVSFAHLRAADWLGSTR